MRGKAKSVLMSLENKIPVVGRFVSFTRENPSDTRSFYCLTNRQIDRVMRVVTHMATNDELELYLHTWGWAGYRSGLS